VLNRRLLCASGEFEANEGESNCLDDASVSNFKHKRSGTHGDDILVTAEQAVAKCRAFHSTSPVDRIVSHTGEPTAFSTDRFPETAGLQDCTDHVVPRGVDRLLVLGWCEVH
jgi:hypothetical protein